MNRPGGLTLTERGLALCAFPPGARLLDVGCGTGDTVRYLRQARGFDCRGIDKDPGVVQGRDHLACAPGDRLPCERGSQDGVLLECSLSVMDDPDQVLAECHRILAPGGRLLISDVYARGQAAELRGCLGRVETRSVLVARIEARGFMVEHFEDFSSHLRALWGQRVLEKGSAALCAELGADRQRLQVIDCGYALLVTRKGEP
jgi:arsenite methyltransferase